MSNLTGQRMIRNAFIPDLTDMYRRNRKTGRRKKEKEEVRVRRKKKIYSGGFRLYRLFLNLWRSNAYAEIE